MRTELYAQRRPWCHVRCWESEVTLIFNGEGELELRCCYEFRLTPGTSTSLVSSRVSCCSANPHRRTSAPADPLSERNRKGETGLFFPCSEYTTKAYSILGQIPQPHLLRSHGVAHHHLWGKPLPPRRMVPFRTSPAPWAHPGTQGLELTSPAISKALESEHQGSSPTLPAASW